MLRTLVAVLGALALLGGEARADLEISEARDLPWSSDGQLLFYLDAASFPLDTARVRTEVYVRIPGEQLAYVDPGADEEEVEDAGEGEITIEARVRYQLKVKNFRGKKVFEEKREVSMPGERDLGGGFSLGHVLLMDLELAPGWYELELKLEDRRSQKRGLLYVGREVHRDGKLKGIFQVPRLDGEALRVSQLEPTWSIAVREGEPTIFSRGRVEVVPNPTRTFGLYQKRAQAYYELHFPEGGERSVTVAARVLDLEGTVLLENEPTRIVVPERTWGQAAFDVSPLASGAYDLELRVEGDGIEPAARTTRINVAWQPESWQRDPRKLEDEVHFLLDDEVQEERFAELTPGEREAFIHEYWKARDPDPTTPRNEERERFYQRVHYANERFGTPGVEKGMFTDRGRTYIRYGPPDEIQFDVMPTHGLQVEDIAREIAQREGQEYAAPLRGRGNIGADPRAYEIWTYDRLLTPTAERNDVGPRRPLRRVFVFVDEEGYGNYLLRYTND